MKNFWNTELGDTQKIGKNVVLVLQQFQVSLRDFGAIFILH